VNACDGTWLPQCEWLALWPLVGVLGGLMAFVAYQARRQLGRFVHGALFERVLPPSVRVRRTLRDALALMGLALALFALAGPRFDKQLQIVRATGTDLVVLLDLSRSMNARDVDPSRLERARREIRDLGRYISGDRVGLVVFAGGAFPRLPLTEDYTALELVVSETDTDSFQAQGSALGEAIREALALLDNHEDQAGQAMIVLSDGETHDPDDALAAAEEAADRGVPIYTMGIGIERAVVPTSAGRPLTWEGETVFSEPRFDTLQDVARLTGGAFVQSTAAANDIAGLYAEIRDSIQAVARDFQQRETWREAFVWPLSVAVLCVLLAGWLGEGRRRFGAAAAVLLALGLTGSPALAGPLEDADELYRDGRYDVAAEEFTRLSLEHPGDVDILQRLGAARYRAGDYDGAARAFDEAAELTDDPDVRFNSGNAHYRAGRLERALERYDDALAESPSHGPASRNRSIVEQEIARRREIQPPPPPPPPQPSQGGESDSDPDGEPQPQDEPQPGEGEPSESERGDEPPPEGEEASDPPPPSDGPDQPGSPSDPTEGPDEPGSSEAVGPDELEPSDETPEGEAAGEPGEIDPTGPITEGQAHRLLDAIEEGSQRVRIRGSSGGKPW